MTMTMSNIITSTIIGRHKKNGVYLFELKNKKKLYVSQEIYHSYIVGDKFQYQKEN
jgi:hypothetical protein